MTAEAPKLLVYKKEGEVYVWQFMPDQKDACIRSIGQMAANSDLSLTWFDVAQLVLRIAK